MVVHVFSPSIIYKIFGGIALSISLVVAFAKCGIDVAGILLFVLAHVFGIGWLVLLVCFPKAALAKKFLAARATQGSEKSENNPMDVT